MECGKPWGVLEEVELAHSQLLVKTHLLPLAPGGLQQQRVLASDIHYISSLPRVHRGWHLQYSQLRGLLLDDGQHSLHDAAETAQAHDIAKYKQLALLAHLCHLWTTFWHATLLLPNDREEQ